MLLTPPVFIETPRLVLRDAERPEALAYTRHYSSDDFRRYLTFRGPVNAKYEFLKLFDDNHKDIQQKPERFLLISEKTAGLPVGLIQLGMENKLTASIGGGIDPAHWNKGYRTEAVTAVTNYAHHALDIPNVIATAAAKNAASCRVLEKSGFRQTAREIVRWNPDEPELELIHFAARRPPRPRGKRPD